MFLRHIKRKKDGKERRYWSILENRRLGGLIFALYKPSVIDASPLLVKDHYQNAGHEIDQIGACRCVHWHDTAFLWDHQVQKLKLHHDDLPRIR